ncbi:cyclase family protein [Streptomyces sp. FXJ1.4098]|nr:cyclase family protein [Streptomyces sp. FXJ1.4098]
MTDPNQQVSPGDIIPGPHTAERGTVARGPLLDVAAARRDAGHPNDHHRGEPLCVGDLEAALERQGGQPRSGDILLLHTGWAAWYLDATPGRRDVIRAERRFTGLDQDREVVARLWDRHFAAVSSRTPTPSRRSPPDRTRPSAAKPTTA